MQTRVCVVKLSSITTLSHDYIRTFRENLLLIGRKECVSFNSIVRPFECMGCMSLCACVYFLKYWLIGAFKSAPLNPLFSSFFPDCFCCISLAVLLRDLPLIFSPGKHFWTAVIFDVSLRKRFYFMRWCLFHIFSASWNDFARAMPV